MTIAAAGLAAPAYSITLALKESDISGLQLGLLEWITIPYLLIGPAAWFRRPESRLGRLMIARRQLKWPGTTARS